MTSEKEMLENEWIVGFWWDRLEYVESVIEKLEAKA